MSMMYKEHVPRKDVSSSPNKIYPFPFKMIPVYFLQKRKAKLLCDGGQLASCMLTRTFSVDCFIVCLLEPDGQVAKAMFIKDNWPGMAWTTGMFLNHLEKKTTLNCVHALPGPGSLSLSL